MRSRTRSPPPVATRIVQGVPDTVKTKILAAADLFQAQLTRRSSLVFISYEEDAHNPLLYSFYFQDKTQTYTSNKIYKLLSQVIDPLSEDVNVTQSIDEHVRVFRVDLAAEDLLRVRPEVFQVLRHPHVQTTVVYLLVFVSIVVASLYWL